MRMRQLSLTGKVYIRLQPSVKTVPKRWAFHWAASPCPTLQLREPKTMHQYDFMRKRNK